MKQEVPQTKKNTPLKPATWIIIPHRILTLRLQSSPIVGAFCFLKPCSWKRSIKHLHIFATHGLDAEKLVSAFPAWLFFPPSVYFHSTLYSLKTHRSTAIWQDRSMSLACSSIHTQAACSSRSHFCRFRVQRAGIHPHLWSRGGCGGGKWSNKERSQLGHSVKKKRLTSPEHHTRYFYIYVPKILKDTATQKSWNWD